MSIIVSVQSREAINKHLKGRLKTMKEALFTYCKVTCAFDWQKENDYSTYHFGSVSGAQEWVVNNINELVWYSIEELEVRPCNENDPSGQLYYGMGYFEFKDKDDLKELKGVLA